MNGFGGLIPFLSHVRWQDLVDVLLVSYLLFRFYVLFRGTYVFRVIAGIGFLWVFQHIAGYLGLIVTTWAMRGIIAFAAIIIIIVFRNEIRNVLQARDIGAILWGVSRKPIETPAEAITAAVYEMAQKRIGALLVFPGKDDLEELLQGGIPWRGVVTKEMLLSIFWPDNPTHDGAAVVQGNRIMEVGAILPLSRRSDLPTNYGTRHRAAMGLCEKTDALVVAVSEESGRVTAMKNGGALEIKDNLALVQVLQHHTGRTPADLNARKMENLKLGAAALASIMLVAAVWFSFSRGLETLVTIEVPIEYMNRDPGMELMDTSLNSVDLSLGGSGALIKAIRPEQIKLRIDLSKAVIGTNAFTITQDNVTLPPGVALRRVDPQEVTVTLDIPVKREFPVQVDWIGKLPEQLVLTEARIDPPRVTIIGGSRILEQISTIYTEKVPLDNIKESGTMLVNLALSPASLKISSPSKEKVGITYSVVKHPPPAVVP